MARFIPVGRSFALVDDQDYEWAMQWRWARLGRGYAVTTMLVHGERKRLALHRALLLPLPGFHVDHINRNPRDNRRSNLRAVSPSENVRNSQRGEYYAIAASLLQPGERYGCVGYGGLSLWPWQRTDLAEVSYHEMNHRRERYYIEQMMQHVLPEYRVTLP